MVYQFSKREAIIQEKDLRHIEQEIKSHNI